MIRKVLCSRCGKSYWEGKPHRCPNDPDRHKERREPTESVGETAAAAGCFLAELGCWLLPFGCLLPASLLGLIGFVVLR